jgi:DHA1 family multidrug resistance protein-like MFS transporter
MCPEQGEVEQTARAHPIGMRAVTTGLGPLYLLAAILDAGFGAVFALLAEIRDQFGLDAFQVGLVGGAGFVSAFMAQVGLARVADRGHARSMLFLGLAAAALAMLALVFATSLTDFVLGRFLFGLGEGMFLPAARRIVITRDVKRAGEALGRLNAFQMTGFLAGPMFGSVVFELFGLRAVFLVTLLVIVGCLPLVARIAIPTQAATSGRRVLRALLARRGIWAMICVGIGYYGSFGLYEAIWAIYLADRGASQLVIGLNLTLFAVPMILIAPRAGRLAERHGGMRVAFIAIALSIPCVAIYGLIESVLLLTLVMMVQAVADAVVMPASQLAVADASGQDIASGQGLVGAAGLATAAITALGSGAVYGARGPVVLFAGYAVLMSLSLLCAWALGRETLRSPTAQALATPSAE